MGKMISMVALDSFHDAQLATGNKALSKGAAFDTTEPHARELENQGLARRAKPLAKMDPEPRNKMLPPAANKGAK